MEAAAAAGGRASLGASSGGEGASDSEDDGDEDWEGADEEYGELGSESEGEEDLYGSAMQQRVLLARQVRGRGRLMGCPKRKREAPPLRCQGSPSTQPGQPSPLMRLPPCLPA